MRVRQKESSRPATWSPVLDGQLRERLVAYFMRRVGNHSDAEDLTQEALARLLGSDRFAEVATGEAPAQAVAYAFRVARNLLLDRVRSGARWRMQEWSVDEASAGPDALAAIVEAPGADRLLIGRESLEEVHSCLSEIDERSKGIFMLARLGGMKQKDIAALYGVSLSTVEQALMATSTHLARRFSRQPRGSAV